VAQSRETQVHGVLGGHEFHQVANRLRCLPEQRNTSRARAR
jgi:hypothetical protein